MTPLQESRSIPKVIEKFDTFFNENTDKAELILYGGSGGSKSHSACQHLIKIFFTVPGLWFMITRKTGPSLKATTWRMIRSVLSDFNYLEGRDFRLNRSDKELEAPNGNIMRFTPIDDPQKIKSASYNVVYVEEITEFTKEDVFFIKNTIRRPNNSAYRNKIIMTFNPIDINHFIWRDIVQKAAPDKSAILHSTHWDNPFLPQEYRDELEGLVSGDENLYRIYTLGEPGVLENIIYRNYTVSPMPERNKKEHIYGLDFGYNNPSALVDCITKDSEPHVKELIYESHLTNSMLIDRMKGLGIDSRAPVYCDAAEPQRIEEIRKAGFNALPAEKNVKDGIDYVKRFRLHISPESHNILSEIRAYSYRKVNEIVIDEPVKFRDHALDAIRYALFTDRKQSHEMTIPITMMGFGKPRDSETNKFFGREYRT